MFARMTLSAVALVGMAALPGCGPAKLDVTKTYTLVSGEAQAVDLPAQPKPQTITVEYDSSAGEIAICVFKEADVPKEDDLLETPASKAIAEKTGEKAGTLTADVPANTATRVVIRDPKKKTEVKLHITNK